MLGSLVTIAVVGLGMFAFGVLNPLNAGVIIAFTSENHMQPREIIRNIENHSSLPHGPGDRFTGYVVIGLPFRTGHVLALRRFPASSVGPGYTSVWHRSPTGDWTFYSNVSPELGCSRYFSDAVTRDVVTRIDIQWKTPWHFCVAIGTRFRWDIELAESTASRALNGCARLVPDRWWQAKLVLKAMGLSARLILGTGPMNLAGLTPNGQQFMANPQRIWLIDQSSACMDGEDFGLPGRLDRQAHLNEFLIPQRGLFAVARAFLETP
jgi:hypothetical protein